MRLNKVFRLIVAGYALIIYVPSSAIPPRPSRDDVDHLASKNADKINVKITNKDLEKAEREKQHQDKERAEKERDRKARENQRNVERNGTGLR